MHSSEAKKNLAPKAGVKRPGVEHKSRGQVRRDGKAASKREGKRREVSGSKEIKIMRRDIKTRKRKKEG